MTRRSQNVDPFSAGDPIMPWDGRPEYVPIDVDAIRRDARRLSGTGSTSGNAADDDHACWLGDDASNTTSKPTGKRTSKPRGQKHRTSKPRQSQAKGSAGSGAKSSGAKSGSTSRRRPTQAAASQAATRPATSSNKPSAGQAVGRAIGRGVGKAAKRKKDDVPSSFGSTVGCLFVLVLCIVTVVSMGVGLVSCVGKVVNEIGTFGSAVGSSFSSSYDSSEYMDMDTYDQVSDQMDEAVVSNVADAMGTLTSGDDELVSRVAVSFETAYKNNALSNPSIPSLEQMGVDATGIARWALTNTAYAPITTDDVSSYSTSDDDTEWSCSTYVSLTTPDVHMLVWDLADYGRDLVRSHGVSADGSVLTDADRADIATKLAELEAQSTSRSTSLWFEYTGSCTLDGSDIEITLDEDEWYSSFDDVYL